MDHNDTQFIPSHRMQLKNDTMNPMLSSERVTRAQNSVIDQNNLKSTAELLHTQAAILFSPEMDNLQFFFKTCLETTVAR